MTEANSLEPGEAPSNSASHQATDYSYERDKAVRPPPPTYSDALAYPSSKQQKQQQHQQSQQRDSKLNGKKVTWQTSLSHQDAVTPITDTVNNCTADKEPIYQTLPGESTYLKYGDTGSHYINIDPETSGKSKLVYSIKKTASGKPLIVLEAIPVTLASSKENMGVKTYAQLEVVAAGSQREGELMCGVGGVTTTTTTGCSGEVRTNGKAVLVPINGTIAPDRMIVDALLNECVRNESLNEELSNGDTRNHSDRDTGDSEVTEAQLNRDVASLTRALSQEDDEKSSQSEEQTPLLQNENAQITFTVENGECSFDRCQERHKDNSKSGRDKQRCDCYECTHNAKFSDCTCMEFKEHVTEQSTDHVTSVIYSEPEYSSSDVSIKCTGAEATCAASRKAENCQKTLKRTHNGVDHTVYELSPSDSFYSSADNVQGAGKGGGASSLESSEGISKLGQSSSSLPEAQTPSQRSRQPLNRETSVSFKKPLVVGPSESTSGGTRGGAEVTSKDSVVIAGDAEPLVTPSNQRTDSSETIPSNLILEDTRTYYNRKAADRGTLYCAAGGITVVATIVFLLIYFS